LTKTEQEMKILFFLFLITHFIYIFKCDIYLHNLRGSNNRNCERNVNLNNYNRLFDSQNSGSGGYACPRSVESGGKQQEKIKLFSGSKLNIEWTTTNNLFEEDSNANIILQYACGKNIRDGIPINMQDDATDSNTFANKDDARQSSHEEYDYYKKCSIRNRNNGLFTADLNVGRGAIHTRQNLEGNKHGWECQEERDYYPYWHPSIWKDIAIFTNNLENCDLYYKGQSQNNINKGECLETSSNEGAVYNNERECKQNNKRWIFTGAHNIQSPICVSLDRAKDSSFLWTVPNDINENCILRIRLNISSSEIPFNLDSR
jgi:hypothetical protein